MLKLNTYFDIIELEMKWKMVELYLYRKSQAEKFIYIENVYLVFFWNSDIGRNDVEV